MKKLGLFGLNILSIIVTFAIGLLAISPIGNSTAANLGLCVFGVTWILFYFGPYLIGADRKSSFLTLVASIFFWLGLGISVLGSLLVTITHGVDMLEGYEGLAMTPFVNALYVMCPFVCLFAGIGYGYIKEHDGHEFGVLFVPILSLVFGYLTALLLSLLGLVGGFFYSWFFLILFVAIVALLIAFRNNLPDSMPFLSIICRRFANGSGSSRSSASAKKSAPVSSSYSSKPSSSSSYSKPSSPSSVSKPAQSGNSINSLKQSGGSSGNSLKQGSASASSSSSSSSSDSRPVDEGYRTMKLLCERLSGNSTAFLDYDENSDLIKYARWDTGNSDPQVSFDESSFTVKVRGFINLDVSHFSAGERAEKIAYYTKLARTTILAVIRELIIGLNQKYSNYLHDWHFNIDGVEIMPIG